MNVMTWLYPAVMLPAVLMVCLGAGFAVTPGSAIADDVVKVVYHADFADPRRFSAMLTSVNNMMNHYENELVDADVRIVFVAHGIRFLTDDALAETPFAADAEKIQRVSHLPLVSRLITTSSVDQAARVPVTGTLP